jgi:hypothetical protein
MPTKVQANMDYLDAELAAIVTHRQVILNIGAWDMQNTGSVAVEHGLDHTKIREMVATIISDTTATMYNFIGDGKTFMRADSEHIHLSRSLGSIFESESYNASVMNRGYVTVRYID